MAQISEAISIAAGCMIGNEGPVQQDRVVYLIASIITFMVETATLADAKFPVW